MARIKSQNTAPEIAARRLLHHMGYRYRLHARDLPGKPDLVFRSRRKAVFVHGCFWHGHDCARGARKPKANADYWHAKIDRNRARDLVNEARLTTAGWTTLTLWECELKDHERLTAQLRAFLGAPRLGGG